MSKFDFSIVEYATHMPKLQVFMRLVLIFGIIIENSLPPISVQETPKSSGICSVYVRKWSGINHHVGAVSQP